MAVKVDGGKVQDINFPVTINAETIDHSLVVNTINKQLSNAFAEIIGNKLNIISVAKGVTASIELLSTDSTEAAIPAEESAYAVLEVDHLLDLPITGSGQYTNARYTVPYSSFPSPLASVDEVVINDANTKMYRYFGGTLREFSEDSAININATAKTVSSVGGVIIAGSHQPCFQSGKSLLRAKPAPGKATNTLVSVGEDAGVVVPLGHDLHALPTGGFNWPDPTGKNKLIVKAKGLGDYQVSGSIADAGVAASLGNTGNALQVNITHAGVADAATITYVAGTGLTIAMSNATTFATLDAAIKNSTALITAANEIEVSLELGGLIGEPADTAALDFTNATPAIFGGGGLAITLSNGADPIDFSLSASATQTVNQGADVEDQNASWMCGAVHMTAATTAAALGIGGETLKVSIDGTTPIAITFADDDAIAPTINTAISAVGACAVTTYNMANELEETFTPLRIHTLSTNGHDSTVEVSADNALVIQRLFSGNTSVSSTGVAPAFDLGGDRRFTVASADYNDIASLNHVDKQKSIVPGTLKLSASGVLALPHIALEAAPGGGVLAIGAAGGSNGSALAVIIDGAAAVNCLVVTPAGGFVDEDPLGDTGEELLVTALNAAFADPANDGNNTSAVDGEIAATILDGSVVIYYHGAANEASPTDTTLELGAVVGTATVQEMSDVLGASALGAQSTAASVTVTLDDSGVDFGLVCTAVSNNFANGVNAHAGDLQNWALGGGGPLGNNENSGLSSSLLDYSAGDAQVAWAGDNETAVVANALPVTLTNLSGTTIDVSGNRSWANCVQAAPQAYASVIHHGGSMATALSDMAWSNGSVLGRIVGIDSFSAGAASFTGAQIVLSEFGVDNTGVLNKWYFVAEGLPNDDRSLEPEANGNDLEKTYAIKHALNRDSAGIAVSGGADVYVDYKALRLDVTASAGNPGLLVFNSIAEVEANIGPIDTGNPLAFGMYLAFLNTTNINIAALGVGEVTPDAPQGTVKGYAEALDFLELKEVYAIAPLSHDMEVFKKMVQHVTDMSKPAAKKERMMICCPELPSEKAAILAYSSNDFEISDIGGNVFEVRDANGGNIMLALNEAAVKDSVGNSLEAVVGGSFSPDQDIFLDREGDAFRYLITALGDTADTVKIEPSNDPWRPGVFGPGTGGNDDAYYNTADPVDWASTGEAGTIFVRQAAVDSSTTGGKLGQCETLGEIAGGVTGFQNRRMVMIQPDQVGVSVGGLETLVPGYYLTGAVAAMIGQQNPSQPFTNLPMVGFTRPVGSNDLFSENAMATAAAGGIYWIIQDVPGGPLVSRHQLTTDLTSIKTRELSILKAVDYVAKLLRGQVKRFIGRNNITKQLLEAISLGISGALASVTGSVVAGAGLDSITQDPDAPDTVRCEVSIIPFYPANYIKITIFV
jgi:hypothetical protein